MRSFIFKFKLAGMITFENWKGRKFHFIHRGHLELSSLI
jgi:hypothetical protein